MDDFARFLQDRDELVPCEKGPGVRQLPADCQESAVTPAELFSKLDQWNYPYLVIPHGNTWGIYTPTLTSWDKQLRAHQDPEQHEYLIEVFSGHGNSEEFRPWREMIVNRDGSRSCPEPTEDFLPACWRAGEIIETRCLADGESAEECGARAATARQHSDFGARRSTPASG